MITGVIGLSIHIGLFYHMQKSSITSAIAKKRQLEKSHYVKIGQIIRGITANGDRDLPMEEVMIEI